MGWVRDYSAENGSDDGMPSGGGSLSIEYIVTGGYTVAQILSNPSAILGGLSDNEPLPTYGSQHPEIPGFYLDRYDPTSGGVNVRVRATYTRNGSGRIPARQAPPEIGNFVFNSDTDEIVNLIPYQVQWFQYIPLPPGFTGPTDPDAPPGQMPAYVWRLENPNTREKYIRRERQSITRHWTKAIIAEENYLAASEAIRRNSNKIHNINGRLFQFVSGSLIKRNGAEGYETTLTWWADDGFNLPEEFYVGGPSNVMFPPRTFGVLPYVGPAMTRPPFHGVDLIEHENADPTTPNVFVVRPIEYLRPNGHLELVGYVEGWTV